ncbi:hypothetical protein U9M48_018773 [Paspalum notatum var. saurae]
MGKNMEGDLSSLDDKDKRIMMDTGKPGLPLQIEGNMIVRSSLDMAKEGRDTIAPGGQLQETKDKTIDLFTEEAGAGKEDDSITTQAMHIDLPKPLEDTLAPEVKKQAGHVGTYKRKPHKDKVPSLYSPGLVAGKKRRESEESMECETDSKRARSEPVRVDEEVTKTFEAGLANQSCDKK